MTEAGAEESKSPMSNRGRLRRTHVVLPGGGPHYPAFVRGPRRGMGRGARPYFSAATTRRIIRDLRTRIDQAKATGEIGDFGVLREFAEARWEGRTLLIPWPERARKRRLRPQYGGLYPLLPPVYWYEVVPPWPRGPVSGTRLVWMLRQRHVNWIVMENKVEEDVPTPVIADALSAGTPNERSMFLRVLGRRDDNESRQVIARFIDDSDAGVRSEAAHAMEHAGVGRFGADLLEAARHEGNPGAREMQLRALGGTKGPMQEVVRKYLTLVAANDDEDAIREAARLALQWVSER